MYPMVRKMRYLWSIRSTDRRRPCPRRRGFSLIDAAITTMIVGFGTVAMMALLVAGTSANQQAARLTTAVNLASDIHELCDRLPFAASNNSWGIPSGSTISSLMTSGNLTWLDGAAANPTGETFSPPLDATGAAISTMSGWSQVVSVSSVNSTNIDSIASSNSTATYPMSRVTVTIEFGRQQVYQTSWLVAR
jgi:Tfp pilus assembly protein PilV